MVCNSRDRLVYDNLAMVDLGDLYCQYQVHVR